MATTEDGIPIIPSKSFQSSQINNNPAQQLANSTPPNVRFDPGYSVAENIFNKSRLDASLEQQRGGNSAAKMNSPKADY